MHGWRSYVFLVIFFSCACAMDYIPRGVLVNAKDCCVPCVRDDCTRSRTDIHAVQLEVLDAVVRELVPAPKVQAAVNGALRDGILSVAHNFMHLVCTDESRVSSDTPRVSHGQRGVLIDGGTSCNQTIWPAPDYFDQLRTHFIAARIGTRPLYGVYGCLQSTCTCSERWLSSVLRARSLMKRPVDTCAVLVPGALGKCYDACRVVLECGMGPRRVILIDPNYTSLAQHRMAEPCRFDTTQRILGVMTRLGQRGVGRFAVLSECVSEHGESLREIVPRIFSAVIAEKSALQFATWAGLYGIDTYVYKSPESYARDCAHDVMPRADLLLCSSCSSLDDFTNALHGAAVAHQFMQPDGLKLFRMQDDSR